MTMPQPMDYFEAVQSPRACFADDDLRLGRVASNQLGLPQSCSGNFAEVYQFCSPSNQIWAIKCFTREVLGLKQRYQFISQYLQGKKFPFTVPFQYIDQGIRIRNQWFPIIKMRWVEGDSLNQFVRKHLGKPKLLESLLQLWIKMAQQLRENQITHADLQHGNVLLVPQTNNKVRLTLIDYDGMLVPTLANQPSGELGHENYQHPQRLRESSYLPAIDSFSNLAICCALGCLVVGGRDLWDRHNNDDNLLFRQCDFENPAGSALFQEIWKYSDPLVHAMVGHLAIACQGPLEQVPLVEKMAGESLPSSLEDHAQRILATKASPNSGPPALVKNLPQAPTNFWWMIYFNCAFCGEKLAAVMDLGGKLICCTNCKKFVAIPFPAEKIPYQKNP